MGTEEASVRERLAALRVAHKREAAASAARASLLASPASSDPLAALALRDTKREELRRVQTQRDALRRRVAEVRARVRRARGALGLGQGEGDDEAEEGGWSRHGSAASRRNRGSRSGPGQTG